jgi:hypothetical protein
MTEQPDTDPMDDAPTLPGLELADPTGKPSELERQIRRSIDRLVELGIVGTEHAGLCQLAIDLAATIGRSRGSAAYGIAQASAQLLATMQALNPETEGGNDDDFKRWQRELRHLGAAGRSPSVRDAPTP